LCIGPTLPPTLDASAPNGRVDAFRYNRFSMAIVPDTGLTTPIQVPFRFRLASTVITAFTRLRRRCASSAVVTAVRNSVADTR
jgi:hypothetical protein